MSSSMTFVFIPQIYETNALAGFIAFKLRHYTDK